MRGDGWRRYSPAATVLSSVIRRRGLIAGLDLDAISYRARAGRLHRIHRGVYAVGHARLGDKGRWKAAVLACGPDAVLSHRSAAGLWRLLPSPHPATDVTVPGRGGRSQRTGIRLHRSATLTPQMTTRRAGIPVTTPARTLLDLRRCVTAAELGRARRQAEVLGYPLGDAATIEPDLTRSELERQIPPAVPPPPPTQPRSKRPRRRLRRRLPLAPLRPHRRDRRLPLPPRPSHFEHDHARQAHLAAAGYEVLRFTWRQLRDDPTEVVAAVRARLTPTLTQPQFAPRHR